MSTWPMKALFNIHQKENTWTFTAMQTQRLEGLPQFQVHLKKVEDSKEFPAACRLWSEWVQVYRQSGQC